MATTLATRDIANDVISPPDSGQNEQGRMVFNPKALKKLRAEYREEIQRVADALRENPKLRMVAQHAYLAQAALASAVVKSSTTPLRVIDPATLKGKSGKVSKNPGSRKGGNKFWQFLCKLISTEYKSLENRGSARGDFHRYIQKLLTDPIKKHRFKKMYIEHDDFREMDKDKQQKFVKEHIESTSFTERSLENQAAFMESANTALNTDVPGK